MDKIIAIAINEYNDSGISDLKNCLNDINSLVTILTTDYQGDFEVLLYTESHQTTLSFLFNQLQTVPK